MDGSSDGRIFINSFFIHISFSTKQQQQQPLLMETVHDILTGFHVGENEQQ
jgi:hypothetical protein